jgi:hypothetical protein
MAQAELPDTEQILNFVELCRDEHIAPYPVGTRVIAECTGLSMYQSASVSSTCSATAD